jgi:hypothetical protein
VNLKTTILGAACAIALGSFVSPAFAVNGTIAGSYAHISAGGGSANVWGADGALEGMFSDDWGAEADGTYHNISNTGDFWTLGANAFWQGSDARVAATYQYHSISGANFNTYGAGAEWFAGPSFTLAAHGGGLSGSGASGGYVGGDIAWYAMPDLAINGSVDYLSIGSVNSTTESISGEWLFSEATPVSVYAGYQHSDFGGANTNAWFVGVKLYANEGASTLVDRQRSGTLGYIAESPLFIDQL